MINKNICHKVNNTIYQIIYDSALATLYLNLEDKKGCHSVKLCELFSYSDQ